MAWLKGCDFSFDKPNLDQLWDAGYRVILVYFSIVSAKGVSKDYAEKALAKGFKILPLYETTANAALGGFAQGVKDARTATSIGASLGCPPEVPIIYAVDFDASTSQLQGPISDYLHGLNSVPGPDAVYAGYDQLSYLIRHGDTTQNFQTYAWSGGRWLSVLDAPVEQYHNGVKVAGGTVDDCRVQDNLIFWEKDMAITAADAKLIAQAVWSADVIPMDPTNTGNPTWRADNSLVSIYQAAKRPFPAIPTAEQIANAVIAALPPAQTGGLTSEDVEKAVLDALKSIKVEFPAT